MPRRLFLGVLYLDPSLFISTPWTSTASTGSLLKEILPFGTKGVDIRATEARLALGAFRRTDTPHFHLPNKAGYPSLQLLPRCPPLAPLLDTLSSPVAPGFAEGMPLSTPTPPSPLPPSATRSAASEAALLYTFAEKPTTSVRVALITYCLLDPSRVYIN